MLKMKPDVSKESDAIYDMGNYADGGEVKKDHGDESGVLNALHDFMMAHGGLGGGDNREFDTAYNVDSSTQPVRNYDDGGEVPPASNPSLWDRIKQVASGPAATIGQIAANPLNAVAQGIQKYAPAIMGAEMNAASGPIGRLAGVPPAPAAPAMPPMPTQPVATPTARPVMPSAPIAKPPVAAPPAAAAPGIPANDLASLIGGAQQAGAALQGDYTPEKRAALLSMMAEKQNGMPYAVGNTLSSVGDAITRGYGRSQSNFLNDTLSAEKDSRKEATDAFDAGSKLRGDEMKEGMAVQGELPSTPQSRLAQAAFAPVLQKMGYSKAQIAAMPDSKISTVADLGLKYSDIQTQKELKDATLKLSAMQAAAGIANAKEERVQTAAKTLEDQGPFKTFFNKITGNPGQAALESEIPRGGGAQAPMTRTIGNDTYVQQGGQWYTR